MAVCSAQNTCNNRPLVHSFALHCNESRQEQQTGDHNIYDIIDDHRCTLFRKKFIDVYLLRQKE